MRFAQAPMLRERGVGKEEVLLFGGSWLRLQKDSNLYTNSASAKQISYSSLKTKRACRDCLFRADRIQFTAPDKSLGVANHDLAAIDAIHLDGHISARLENNRRIEFNAGEHRHFDHGYAITSHSSQGLTAERVLVHADTSVHPDLLNSRFGYVSISRASHEATLFTDDISKLGPQLGADVSKTSALEINHYEPSQTMSSNGVLLQI
jgi:ATP-dependent exoDNAse (exonuclease V) alpha subunit